MPLIPRSLRRYLIGDSSSALNLLRRSPRLFFLSSINIYPTNICNYDCMMCESAKSIIRVKNRMDFALMQKILRECGALTHKPVLHFAGHGEPLVYEHIRPSMELCRELGLKWTMNTNGDLLGRHAEEIIDNRAYAINLSFHGTAETHDQVVKIPGSYQRVIKGLMKIDELKKARGLKTPIVSVNCVINTPNLEHLERIAAEYTALPIDRLSFQHLIFSEQEMDDPASFVIRGEERLAMLTEFCRKMEQGGHYRIPVTLIPKIGTGDVHGYYTDRCHPFAKSCLNPWLSVRVHYNGDVEVCKQILGNVRDHTLREVINSEKAREFRRMIRDGGAIPACFRCCHRHYY
ncbi:MAG: radical SAM protein [Magnetococcales bacterium]|nr:radical SAM protein [Magnetococcales bacterium]